MGKIEGAKFNCGVFDLIEILDPSSQNEIIGCTFNGLGENQGKEEVPMIGFRIDNRKMIKL